jgi:hypothetical protein
MKDRDIIGLDLLVVQIILTIIAFVFYDNPHKMAMLLIISFIPVVLQFLMDYKITVYRRRD